MAKATIFYGTSTGNTKMVAELIAEAMGDLVADTINISDASPSDLEAAEALILGTSTWDDGQLQQDWDDFFPDLDDVNFSGKTVALFGLGDADGYSGEFVNALRTIYDKVKEQGGNIVGEWPVDEYEFDDSAAVIDGKFVGLVIDEDNESEKTEKRVQKWVEQIRPAFS